jgi:LPLT family lysophospholipid transporter-like MFS transporter
MMAVICAQFLSAFGDNALLFATLALMKQLYYPEWSQPVLQMLFVGAYILFARLSASLPTALPKAG